jgi:hypothetical protein
VCVEEPQAVVQEEALAPPVGSDDRERDDPAVLHQRMVEHLLDWIEVEFDLAVIGESKNVLGMPVWVLV